MSLDYYPKVKVPKLVREWKDHGFPMPGKPIEPNKPEPPVIPKQPPIVTNPQPDDNTNVLVIIIAIIISIVLITTGNVHLSIAGFIFIGIAIATYAINYSKNKTKKSSVSIPDGFYDQYKVDKKEYDSKMEKYNKDNINYQTRLTEYNNIVQERLMYNTEQEFTEAQIIKYLRSATPFTKNTSGTFPTIGFSELHFYTHLRFIFKDYVVLWGSKNSVSLTYENPFNQNIYTSTFYPDIIIHLPDRGLYVDIEIDEPYTLNEKKPIHLIGEDQVRDHAFLTNKWVVIRFTERQIIREAEGCIYTIINTIHTYMSHKNLHFLKGEPLKLEKHWSLQDVQSMIIRNTREEDIKFQDKSEKDIYKFLIAIFNGYQSLNGKELDLDEIDTTSIESDNDSEIV